MKQAYYTVFKRSLTKAEKNHYKIGWDLCESARSYFEKKEEKTMTEPWSPNRASQSTPVALTNPECGENSLGRYAEIKEAILDLMDPKNPDHIKVPGIENAPPIVIELIISGLALRYSANSRNYNGGQLITPADVNQVVNCVMAMGKYKENWR